MKSYARVVRSVLLICLMVVLLQGALVTAQDASGGVSLTSSDVTWSTLAYQLDANHGMVRGSLDAGTAVEHTFSVYVLENEYLKVTLLPEYGGRILSIIYKPTGHEELYQESARRALRHRRGQFLLRLADGLRRHLPDLPGAGAR